LLLIRLSLENPPDVAREDEGNLWDKSFGREGADNVESISTERLARADADDAVGNSEDWLRRLTEPVMEVLANDISENKGMLCPEDVSCRDDEMLKLENCTEEIAEVEGNDMRISDVMCNDNDEIRVPLTDTIAPVEEAVLMGTAFDLEYNSDCDDRDRNLIE
jgi:hypothetical protein